MSQTLSVVIASRNCADRLEGTVLPWRPIATEIIVADQMSTDDTVSVSQKLGCRLIRNDPYRGNFDLNRKMAMLQATGDWILYIDTDERPTPDLLAEIRMFLASRISDSGPEAVRIPNIFYFLGKPLRHGIYNPKAAEIRMVRQGKWTYPCEDGFHRGISVKGEVIRFVHPYKHFNVNSISEWFIKTNQYTEHDAEKFVIDHSNLKCFKPRGTVAFAINFFIRHYFFRCGFLDGFHGFVSVVYFMFYHFTLRVKYWEKVNQKGLLEERDYLKPLEAPRR